MTGRRSVAALLARLFPRRGRHTRQAAPQDPPPPPPPGWYGHHDTSFDIPPLRPRPYVDRGDEDDEHRGWLP